MVNNMSDLSAFIKSSVKPQVKYALQRTGKEVEQMVKDYIMQEMYSIMTSDYTRSYEFINSVSHTNVEIIGNMFKVTVYFDTDKIKPHIIDGEWNQHADFYGNDVSDSLVLWIEEGTSNQFYSHPGINSMETVGSWTKKIKQGLEAHLVSTGLNVRVR